MALDGAQEKGQICESEMVRAARRTVRAFFGKAQVWGKCDGQK